MAKRRLRARGHRVIVLPEIKSITDHPNLVHQPHKWHKITLDETRVFRISRRSINLVIGGPPNSGKSTIAASLVAAINAELESLQSRGGKWAALKYGATLTTLDPATPVAESVLRGEGNDRYTLKQLKKGWDNEVVLTAIRHLLNVLQQQPALVVSDLPGVVDQITISLIKHARFAVIVGRDRGHFDSWRELFDRHGIHTAAELRSCDVPSMVTRLDRSEGKLFGRIFKYDRVAVPWDPTIRTLAEVLLFEILPMMNAKMRNT